MIDFAERFVVDCVPSCIWECPTVDEDHNRNLVHCKECPRHMGFCREYIKCRGVDDDGSILEAPLYNLIDPNSYGRAR